MFREPHMFMRNRLTSIAAAVFLVGHACHAGVFTGVGGLRPDLTSTVVHGLSADGTYVVGSSLNNNTSSRFEAFRWSRQGGMEGLGFLDTSLNNHRSRAYGVSRDGSVIAGDSPSRLSTISLKGMVWTENNGMQHIPNLPGGSYSGFARDVDDAGTYIAGNDSNNESAQDNGRAAYRWNRNNSTFDTLGDLSGGRYFAEARGISGDGTAVAGYSESSNGNEAFVWTESGGMVGLGDLSGGTFSSFGEDVSNSGAVVGFGRSASGTEAFRWTQAGGMEGLGDFAGGSFVSAAYSVSADGSLVGGLGNTADGQQAFLWDAVNGMRQMSDVLAMAGLNLTGWTLLSVEGISENGMIFAGRGINPDGDTEGWYADMTPVPEPGAVLLLAAGTIAACLRCRRNRKCKNVTSD